MIIFMVIALNPNSHENPRSPKRPSAHRAATSPTTTAEGSDLFAERTRRPWGGPRISWPATIVYSTTWALFLAVTVMWVHAGGINELNASVSQTLGSLGRLTGLIGSMALLIQVFMMARVPFVESALGQDRLTTMHRWLGFSSFSLIMVHILLLIAQDDQSITGMASTFWDMTWNYPGMLLAVAGTAAIIMVVVTSFKAARRSMRYENWHLIHLYGYLGAALAIPHQLWSGSDFMGHPTITALWWALWGITAAAVIVFRVVVPLASSAYFNLRVSQVDVLDNDLVRVRMTGRHLERMRVAGGQYFNWRFAGEGVTRAIPLSLSAYPDGRSLEITAAMVGAKSHRLSTLKPGTRVFIEGPYGRFHKHTKSQPHTVLLGSGTGLMPVISLLETLPVDGTDIVVIARASSSAQLPYHARLEELCALKGAKFYALTGHRSPGSWQPTGHSLDDDAAFKRLVPHLGESDVFICGPNEWMKLAAASARRAGAGEVHSEKFAV